MKKVVDISLSDFEKHLEYCFSKSCTKNICRILFKEVGGDTSSRYYASAKVRYSRESEPEHFYILNNREIMELNKFSVTSSRPETLFLYILEKFKNTIPEYNNPKTFSKIFKVLALWNIYEINNLVSPVPGLLYIESGIKIMTIDAQTIESCFIDFEIDEENLKRIYSIPECTELQEIITKAIMIKKKNAQETINRVNDLEKIIPDNIKLIT